MINDTLYTTSSTEFAMETSVTEYKIKMRAIDSAADKLSSNWSSEITKIKLDKPILEVDGDTVTWDAVPGANYRVIINGTEEIVLDTNSYKLPPLTSTEYDIKVRIEKDGYITSDYSDLYTFEIFTVTFVTNNETPNQYAYLAKDAV